MTDFLFWFGILANAITVLAGVIAIAGVIWAYLGRARVDVSYSLNEGLSPSVTIRLTSTGSNPVHDIELSVGTLDDAGFSMMGDGAGRRPTLSRGESLSIVGYESAEVVFGDEPRDGEVRFEIQHDDGFYVNAQWRSPVFPWRRVSRTFAWPPSRRFASEVPEELTGRKEIAFFKRAQDPALNPNSPSFVAPSDSSHAVEATDETFDGLMSGFRGPVLVGFGPTWQGQWWTDVKRMLSVLALRHAPRVMVLTVDIDHCPHLAARYDTDVVPTFKLFRNGAIVKTHNGVGSLPELERAFAGLLR